MHGMVPCSCCTSRSSTGLHAGKSRFVMVAMTWKVYDWSHVFASCHGNHEWMKGLAEALKINTALIFKAPAKRFIEPWFQWQIWFGLTSFQNTFSIMSLHKAQHWLNPPKVCKSNLHTALSHCTASWHFSALHYQFQMAPIIRENVCVLDNFSAWSSINRINGQKCHQKKMTWMTCMMHGMVPCSCCTSRSSTGLQAGKSRFVMVAMTWKVYDWTHVVASFVMETTSEWKVWPKPWRSTRRDLQGPSQTFHRAMVSMTNLVWARLGWLPFRTPSVSCHSARLNIGSTLQRSAKVTCTLHCRTALPLGISVRFIISFKWPPSYVKTSASWTISLREVASIESMGKNAIKKNDMDDLHDARHGPLFMLYLKKLDWTAGRKVQVRHGRHDMEGLRLNTCCCQLCHGNHEWMKGLAEALEVNTAWSSRPQPNVSSSHGFNDKFGLGWLPFRTPSVSCHSRKAQHWLNPPKVCKSNLTLHCRTALPLGISVRFIISFKWPPSYVKTSASWTISLREVASIESMGKNAIKKKWHGWPAWCTAWSLVHAVPQEARLDCRSESPGSSWSPWHGRSTTEHMFLPALSWKPRVNERSGRSLGGQHGVIFKAPAKRFIEPWFQWQIWFGLTSFREHLQYHVTPQGSTLAQPSKGL